MTKKTERLLIVTLVLLASTFLVLAALNGQDKKINTQANEDEKNLVIEYLPKSGAATACKEPVGVILKQGYGAKLTINGKNIRPEDLNVFLNQDGTISKKITASRSRGEYSYKVEDNCPNGELIRVRDNKLKVCIYSLSNPNQDCLENVEYVFDAI